MSRALIEAAKLGESQRFQKLLLQGELPDTCDPYGETSLTWAAHLGRTAIVKDLLAAGANIEIRGNLFCMTPLLLAARGGHRGIVALLSVQADLDAQDAYGATALMLAVEKYEPRLKPQHRILTIINNLLDAGANPNQQDFNGDTALMWAVRWQNLEAVEMLLAHGVDTSIQNRRGWTADELADARGQTELSRLIENYRPIESKIR